MECEFNSFLEDKQNLSIDRIEDAKNSKTNTEAIANIVKLSNGKSNSPSGSNMSLKSVKRINESQWKKNVNTKRKKNSEVEEEDEFEFGAPYVVLTQDNGNPITCYMVPKTTDGKVNQYIATSSQNISSSNQSVTQLVLNQVTNQNQATKLIQNGTSKTSPVKINDNQSSLSASLIATNNICSSIIHNAPKIELNSLNQTSTALPPIKPKPNQIQITTIDPSSSSPQVITKVRPLLKSSGPTDEPTFPVRQVLPKIKKEASNTPLLLETRNYLQEKITSLKEELNVTKWQLNEQKKSTCHLRNLQDKLISKKRQIKTMCTQVKRLSKRLECCKEELEKTRKALELVESQAVLWNNANMSDLGKLIFSLHTVKSRKLMDSRSAANKAPPEVKGFVISLYMTSPKAYQLVRDCFNGLPHPKTVAKWLHGERVEDSDLTPPVPTLKNEAALEETFTRVIETEDEQQMQQQIPQVQVSDETTETTQFITEGEIIHNDDSGAVYYVLDEKGNVTGQLSGADTDLIFSADGFELSTVSAHEVVIGE